MNRSLALVLVSVGIAVGCSSTPDQSASGGGENGAGGSPAGSGTNSSASSSVAASSSSGSAATSTLDATVDKDLALCGNIEMPKTSTIAAGATLTLCPTSKLFAAKDAELIVAGKLVVDATAATPVVFQSKEHAGPGGWVGLHVQSGGEASLKHIEIYDAKLAFNASAGAKYGIDYIVVDASSIIAKLESTGTLAHGKLHALGAAQSGSPITVNSASPVVSDTVIDKANGTTDHIIVTGTSSGPVFDHVDISQCHCSFHFSQGNGATISNSIVHDSVYGLMAFGTIGTKITNSNFVTNQTNIGLCMAGGDVTATGSYFDDAAFDTSCAGQTLSTPATKPLTDIGARP